MILGIPKLSNSPICSFNRSTASSLEIEFPRHSLSQFFKFDNEVAGNSPFYCLGVRACAAIVSYTLPSSWGFGHATSYLWVCFSRKFILLAGVGKIEFRAKILKKVVRFPQNQRYTSCRPSCPWSKFQMPQFAHLSIEKVLSGLDGAKPARVSRISPNVLLDWLFRVIQ